MIFHGNVINDSLFTETSILSPSPSVCAISMSADVIWVGTLRFVFL